MRRIPAAAPRELKGAPTNLGRTTYASCSALQLWLVIRKDQQRGFAFVARRACFHSRGSEFCSSVHRSSGRGVGSECRRTSRSDFPHCRSRPCRRRSTYRRRSDCPRCRSRPGRRTTPGRPQLATPAAARGAFFAFLACAQPHALRRAPPSASDPEDPTGKK